MSRIISRSRSDIYLASIGLPSADIDTVVSADSLCLALFKVDHTPIGIGSPAIRFPDSFIPVNCGPYMHSNEAGGFTGLGAFRAQPKILLTPQGVV
jgi:hypothetical protein